MRKPGWRSQESEISRFQPAPPPLSSCPSTRDAEAHLPGVETEAPPPPPQGRPVRARGGRGAPGGGARLWNLSPGRRDAATAGGHGAGCRVSGSAAFSGPPAPSPPGGEWGLSLRGGEPGRDGSARTPSAPGPILTAAESRPGARDPQGDSWVLHRFSGLRFYYL